LIGAQKRQGIAEKHLKTGVNGKKSGKGGRIFFLIFFSYWEPRQSACGKPRPQVLSALPLGGHGLPPRQIAGTGFG
jgi:hypothetical protein